MVQNNNEDPIEYLFHISYENIKVVIVMRQLKINLLKTKDLTELSENEHFSSKIFILFEWGFELRQCFCELWTTFPKG